MSFDARHVCSFDDPDEQTHLDVKERSDGSFVVTGHAELDRESFRAMRDAMTAALEDGEPWPSESLLSGPRPGWFSGPAWHPTGPPRFEVPPAAVATKLSMTTGGAFGMQHIAFSEPLAPGSIVSGIRSDFGSMRVTQPDGTIETWVRDGDTLVRPQSDSG